MFLLLDNYDSFTWNVYHFLAKFNVKVKVIRNDKINIKTENFNKYKGIIFSPGPGKPENAGEMMNIINLFKNTIPMLGICLGHQAIGACFGAKVVKMNKVMHGKTDNIRIVKRNKIFKYIPDNFIATRYHSLEISNHRLPKSIEILANTKGNNIMGIKVKNKNIFGLQFHPESIATSYGETFFSNFINECNKK